MGASVPMHTSASPESVTQKELELALAGKRVRPVRSMTNVTNNSLADRITSGRLKQLAFLFQRWGPSVNLNMTARQETSAGNLKQTKRAFAWRNTQRQTTQSLFGTLTTTRA